MQGLNIISPRKEEYPEQEEGKCQAVGDTGGWFGVQ